MHAKLTTAAGAAALLLAACGTGGDGSTPPPAPGPATPALRAAFMAIRQSDPQHSTLKELVLVRDGHPRVVASVRAKADAVVGVAVLSPDGAQIALRGPHGEAQVMRADGSGRHTVAAIRGADAFAFAFSPDGRTLVVDAGTDGTNDADELYAVPVTGGRPRRLTHNRVADEDPVVAPDERVLFDRDDQASGTSEDLWEVGLDGTGERQLTHDERLEYGPSVSPDGKQIAYTTIVQGDPRVTPTDQRIDVAARDGSRARTVVGRPPAGGYETTPVWSPDGTQLLFESDRQDLQAGLWVVPVAGGAPRPVLLGPGARRYTAPSAWVAGR